jgi:hypothetical protein
MEVYYISRLQSNIISIGQLDERGCQVLVDNGMLRIRDRERRLLVKVKWSRNRLYILNLHLVQPVCLAARASEEPWLWHACFRHLRFDALGRMAKEEMVHASHTSSTLASYVTAA